jgi:outer membrane protein OmpA-like peptidoglycan-associated protein
MIKKQLKDLREYSKFSEKTLDLYKEEYDLGRRSLLDLLSAQNDVINSRSQIIKAEYDQLFAKYRILDAMGLLVVAINGSADEFTSKVNLYTDENAKEILDTVPVKYDVDNDEIADNIDLCDNSLKVDNIMPYGCKKYTFDDDLDGINNKKDRCPSTPVDVKVNEDGCELDSDKDGVVDSKDMCKDTPLGYGVDEKGCTNLITMSVNFKKSSFELSETLKDKVIEFAKFLKSHPDLKASIVGHTSRTNVSGESYNITLSKKRAKAIKQALIDFGIDEVRLSSDGKGFSQPIADNSTHEGRVKNRRVEIELSRIDLEEI